MADQEPLSTDAVEEIAESEAASPVSLPLRPRKVSSGMWGPLEIGVVSFAALIFFAVVGMYFVFVIPSNRELARNKSENDRLEAEQISARSKYGEMTDTETQVAKIVSSVDDFESRFLPAITNGRPALYQRLNSLIEAYGLVNTSGPDYTSLDPADQNEGSTSDAEKGRAKFRSLYPGIYIRTTVEGTYQNLRRFLREIETGREFVVVSSVQLSPSDASAERKTSSANAASDQAENNAGPIAVNPNSRISPSVVNPASRATGQEPTQQVRPRQEGKMHGEVVALSIELAAYFRRPNFAPMTLNDSNE